jgi:hypothetical protein
MLTIYHEFHELTDHEPKGDPMSYLNIYFAWKIKIQITSKYEKNPILWGFNSKNLHMGLFLYILNQQNLDKEVVVHDTPKGVAGWAQYLGS